jgi:hypothetical protein
MSSSEDAPEPKPSEHTPEPTPPALVRYVADNRTSVGYALLSIGAVLIVLTVMGALWWFADYPKSVVACGVILVAAMMFSGVERLLRPSGEGSELDAARMMVLGLGGGVGLALTVLGVLFTINWWDDIVTWADEIGPGKNAWRAIAVSMVIVAGLALMFVSLQLGRTEERSNINLRRLVYGYNAGLTGVLVLMILVVLIVFVAVFFKTPLDFTASGNYTLNKMSVNILKKMEGTVEIIHVRGFRNGFLEDEVRTLLANCREVTDKVQVKELDPEIDQQGFRDLSKKYPSVEGGSILLLYQDGEKKDHRVIEEKALAADPDRFDPNPVAHHRFLGEDALMTALSNLSDNQKQMAVYFIQGHNELDINDPTVSRMDTGAGVLKKRLEEKRNFEIKPLKLDPLDPKMPADAALVVIAGPRQPYDPAEVRVLQNYMNTKTGRMLVMLEPVIAKDQLVSTGLEEFMMEFGIELPAERLLTYPAVFVPRPGPLEVVAQMNPQLARSDPPHPLAGMFGDMLVAFENTRPLRIVPNPAPGPRRFMPQPLMRSLSFSFRDSDWATGPAQIIAALRGNEAALKAKAKEVKNEVIAAIVTESSFDPRNPHAMMGPPTEQKPKMVVFGNAGMASNRSTREQSGAVFFDLIASSIEWLREKPQNIGIPPKQRNAFVVQPKTDADGDRMKYLPLPIVVLFVLGLAGGVWVVRRR